MDGDLPLRITHDGDHLVVHLPAGISLPDDATVRQEGARVVIEPKRTSTKTLAELLREMALEGPLAPEDQMPPIERGPAKPFDL
ncbi:MAG: hypothetical protein EON96_14625 [Caulobacteraceae bacterium]|nr:MAG: hypothetical protein EON96_14625 [Caulobacteraceae bacterium]